VVQTVNAQRDATRFNILFQAGHAGFDECNVTAIGIPTIAGSQNEMRR
jgi:hypothetical protein